MHGIPVDSSCIRVEWQPPPRIHRNGAITYYKVIYFEDTNPSKKIELNVTSNESSIELKNLNKWTKYRISVLAGTEVGDGPASEPIVLQTDEDGKSGSENGLHWLTLA